MVDFLNLRDRNIDSEKCMPYAKNVVQVHLQPFQCIHSYNVCRSWKSQKIN